MRTLICLLLFCFALRAGAQQRYNPDSLLQVLEHTQGGVQRAELLRHLSRAYIGSDKTRAESYAKQSLDEAEKTGNDTIIVRSLNNMAAALQNSGDKRESLPFLDRAIELTHKNGNKAQLLESLSFKATALASMRQTDKALPPAQEALGIATELKDSVGILNCMEVVAAAYKELRHYQDAAAIYQQELDMLAFLPKRIFEKGRACVNLGEVCATLEQRDKAVNLFERGRDYFKQMQYTVGQLIASLNLADGYMNQNRLAEAEATYREILNINEAVQEPELNAISFHGLAVINMKKRQYDAALPLLKQSEETAKNAGLLSVLKSIYSSFNDLYCLKGDYDGAQEYKLLSEKYADSLLQTDVRDRITEYQVQYETVQKEKEITEQQLQITAQKGEIFRKNTLNYSLAGIMLALIALGWLFYNRFRLRKNAELDAAIIREQKLGLNAVIEAQEAERRRIGKDLHDGIAQELVALKLGFDALGRRIGRVAPDEIPRFEEIKEQLDVSCTEVRSISHLMSPPVLEQYGLAPSLELLLRNTLKNSGLQTNFTTRDLPSELDRKVEIGLYRIAQELINNIVKHARATHVNVELYRTGSDLVMRVEDDGVGFNFEEARARGSMGLLNILSRAGALGGIFMTENANPHGAVSLVRVPV